MMRTLAPALLAIVLAGCGSAEVAEVVDRSVTRSPPARTAPLRVSGPTVTVARGDTLYAIAFRLGTDFRRLAALNGIRAPYTIYPGQRLRLDPGMRPSPPPPRRAQPVPHVGPLPLPPPRREPATVVALPESRTQPAAPADPVPRIAEPAPPAPTPEPASQPERPVVATITPDRSRTSAGIAWRWPARGRVLSRFVAGDPARQGVDIAGSEGEPVLAVADGQVVYSGNGLLGYGELIIIKHSNAFLSAYGHNRKRLLGEGARVQAGQQIAEMGRSGAGIDLLHFEIRRNGKPVDPLGLLPPR